MATGPARQRSLAMQWHEKDQDIAGAQFRYLFRGSSQFFKDCEYGKDKIGKNEDVFLEMLYINVY